MSSPTSPTSPVTPVSPSEGIYRALQVYIPQHDGEIGLGLGDVITSAKELGNGWTLGRNVTRDTLGIFPSQLIAPLADLTLTPQDPTPMSTKHKPHQGRKTPPPGKQKRNCKVPKSIEGPSHRGKDWPGHRLLGKIDERGHQDDRRLEVESPEAGVGSVTVSYPVQHLSPTHGRPIATVNDSSPDSIDDTYAQVQKVPRQPDPEESDLDYSVDISPADVEYSSLPTPKKGKYATGKNTAGKKPHMVVKPNLGKNPQQPPQQEQQQQQQQQRQPRTPKSRPIHRMRSREFTPERGATPPVSMSTIPTPPQIAHVLSTPGAPRQRTSAPPGQLPVIPLTDLQCLNATDSDKASEVDDDNSPCGQNLGVPHTQDRSTSPIIPARVAPPIPLPPQDIHLEIERDNIANESLTQSQRSPGQHSNKDRNGKQVHYHDYRTLECPPAVVDPQHAPPPSRYNPILRNRHQKVADSKGQHIYYKDQQDKPQSSRLILSILAGLFFGSLVFLWMYFYLGYSFLIAVATGVSIGLVLCIMFALSRLCRCIGGILLLSSCTTRGRIGYLIIVTGFLLSGPVTNVYHNMKEISTSMSCSADQAYNQTMLLLEPFDGMMQHLNGTIFRLQRAAFEVNIAMTPLNKGLVETKESMGNGKEQLDGIHRMCHDMVDRAYNECSSGMNGAQSQCKGVMGALSIVYRHAQKVLDHINPDRWAPKLEPEEHDHLFRRDTIVADSELEDLPVPQGNQDICEPLDTMMVCDRLNDSDALCRPSTWASEAIRVAINKTQTAMGSLQSALQFEISSKPYYNTRVNASKLIYEVRKKVEGEFNSRTANFELVISILLKIIPIGVLLLVYVSYLHIKHYMSKDTYDNIYVTDQFRALDQKRSEVAGESLLPLKRFERNYLVDNMGSDLSPPEDGLYRIGLCVLLLHMLLSFVCYMFDYILYWVLSMIERHSTPSFDTSGRESLRATVVGEGVIVDLLHYFLEGFHPGNLFGYTADTYACLPEAHAPSIINLLVVFIFYFVLILTILLKAYILRFRNKVSGYFYPERQKARVVHLYNVILNQRSRMPKILQQKAKSNNREKLMMENISLWHKMAGKCPPCRVFLYESPRCLVCGTLEDQTFRDCDTDKCTGVYCNECFEDLVRICPLCLQGMVDGSDEEDYEELEDDLQPYSRSSKIYL